MSIAPLPKEKTEKNVQLEQGETKVDAVPTAIALKGTCWSEEAVDMNEEFDRWCQTSGYGDVSERQAEKEQIKIRAHLRDMELKQERWEQEEEARVFKAKAKKKQDG